MQVVDLLLACDADVHAADCRGDTALHYAASASREMTVVAFRVIESLLAHGAEANARDKQGKTPLDHAVERGRRLVMDDLILRLLRLHATG